MSWDSFIEDVKVTAGGIARRAREGPREYYGPARPQVMKNGEHIADKIRDGARGFQNINRNSIVGETHGVISRAFGNTTAAKWGTGAGMAVAGLGANSFVQNEMQNHPGMAPAIGTLGVAAGAAAVLDPAILSKMFTAGSKTVSKIGPSVAPGVVSV